LLDLFCNFFVLHTLSIVSSFFHKFGCSNFSQFLSFSDFVVFIFVMSSLSGHARSNASATRVQPDTRHPSPAASVFTQGLLTLLTNSIPIPRGGFTSPTKLRHTLTCPGALSPTQGVLGPL
jgi:hypothetical protein